MTDEIGRALGALGADAPAVQSVGAQILTCHRRMREQHSHSSIHLSVHDLPQCLLTISYLAGPSGLGKDLRSERSRFCPCLRQWQYPLPFRYRRMSSSHRCRRCRVRRRQAIQRHPFRSSTIPFLPAVLTSYFRHGSSPAIHRPCPRVSPHRARAKDKDADERCQRPSVQADAACVITGNGSALEVGEGPE
jgi:hypothetical protein